MLLDRRRRGERDRSRGFTPAEPLGLSVSLSAGSSCLGLRDFCRDLERELGRDARRDLERRRRWLARDDDNEEVFRRARRRSSLCL